MNPLGGGLAGEAFAFLHSGNAEGEFTANDGLVKVEALAVAA